MLDSNLLFLRIINLSILKKMVSKNVMCNLIINMMIIFDDGKEYSDIWIILSLSTYHDSILQ